MGQLVLQPAPTVSLSPQTRHLPAVGGQRLSPSATLRWWQSRSCSHVCSASPGLSRQCRCPRHARTYMRACMGACSHACPRRPTHAHLPKCISAETNMHPCARKRVGTPMCLCTPLVHTPPHTSTPRFTHTCMCPCTHTPHAHPCRCKHHTHTYMRALPCTRAPTCVHAAPTGLSSSLQCGTGCSGCCGSSSLPPAPAFLSPCHPIGTLVSSLVPLHRLQPPPPHPMSSRGWKWLPGSRLCSASGLGVTCPFGDSVVTLVMLMSLQVISGVVQTWCGALRGHQGRLHGGRRMQGDTRGRGGQGVCWAWTPAQGTPHGDATTHS